MFSFGLATAIGNLGILLLGFGEPVLSIIGILWGLLGYFSGF